MMGEEVTWEGLESAFHGSKALDWLEEDQLRRERLPFRVSEITGAAAQREHVVKKSKPG